MTALERRCDNGGQVELSNGWRCRCVRLFVRSLTRLLARLLVAAHFALFIAANDDRDVSTTVVSAASTVVVVSRVDFSSSVRCVS